MVSGHTLPTTSGRPFQPVADHEEHVPHAPVLQVDQDAHPELRAFPAGPGPQPEDVLLAVEGDADRGLDGPVGDLPIADLHHDRVHENRRVDLVEGRCCHDCMYRDTLSVILEIVSRGTDAP